MRPLEIDSIGHSATASICINTKSESAFATILIHWHTFGMAIFFSPFIQMDAKKSITVFHSLIEPANTNFSHFLFCVFFTGPGTANRRASKPASTAARNWWALGVERRVISIKEMWLLPQPKKQGPNELVREVHSEKSTQRVALGFFTGDNHSSETCDNVAQRRVRDATAASAPTPSTSTYHIVTRTSDQIWLLLLYHDHTTNFILNV